MAETRTFQDTQGAGSNSTASDWACLLPPSLRPSLPHNRAWWCATEVLPTETNRQAANMPRSKPKTHQILRSSISSPPCYLCCHTSCPFHSLHGVHKIRRQWQLSFSDNKFLPRFMYSCCVEFRSWNGCWLSYFAKSILDAKQAPHGAIHLGTGKRLAWAGVSWSCHRPWCQ